MLAATSRQSHATCCTLLVQRHGSPVAADHGASGRLSVDAAACVAAGSAAANRDEGFQKCQFAWLLVKSSAVPRFGVAIYSLQLFAASESLPNPEVIQHATSSFTAFSDSPPRSRPQIQQFTHHVGQSFTTWVCSSLRSRTQILEYTHQVTQSVTAVSPLAVRSFGVATKFKCSTTTSV